MNLDDYPMFYSLILGYSEEKIFLLMNECELYVFLPEYIYIYIYIYLKNYFLYYYIKIYNSKI